MKHINQNIIEQMTNSDRNDENQGTTHTGGLPVRTDLRAGLAWDDLDDKAQDLWSSLTSAVSDLAGGTDTGS